MDQRSNSRLSLFLMELIVAIMFFSLSAAVCVRLFSSAHFMSENTKNMSNATVWTQNLAETFESEKGDLSAIAKFYPEAYITYDHADTSMRSGAIVLFFDSNWDRIDSLPDASYVAYLSITTKDASEVYKDVTDYNVALVGKAAVGDIAVLDIRGIEDFSPDAVVEQERYIMSFSVDTYLGKEAY